MSPKKIKILFITDNLWHNGGAQNQLFLLLKNINKELFEAYVCSLNSEKDYFVSKLRDLEIGVFIIPQKGFFDLVCLLKLYFLIKKLKPDIINTFLYTAEFYGRLAGLLAGIRIIVNSVRNIDIWKKRRNIWADRILNIFTNHFIVNSYAVKDYIIKRYRIKEYKISVIYNGIDLERLKYTEKKSDLNIDKNKRIILNIARFEPQKDHLTLIRSAEIVVKERKDVLFVLVGKGKEKEKIKFKIEEAGMKDNFIILEEVENPASLYNLAYLGVLSSLYEGCSNFILECMAFGKPVVATDVGGNSELIINGKTGFLVEKKNPSILAERIIYLLDYPEVAQQLGGAGKDLVEKNFSLKNMVFLSEELFKKIVK